MKYRGIELKEITEPQICKPPKKMLVWNNTMDYTIASMVVAIAERMDGLCAMCYDGESYHHCAEIPKEPKPKMAMNLELSKWLAQGNGEVLTLMQMVNGSSREMVETAWHYFSGEDYDEVEYGFEGQRCKGVRKWDETEWNEPTVEYLGLRNPMPINHDMMHSQSRELFEKSCDVFEGIAKLKEKIAELEAETQKLREDCSSQTEELCLEKENVWQLENVWKETRRALWLLRAREAKTESDYWYYTHGIENFVEGCWSGCLYGINHQHSRELGRDAIRRTAFEWYMIYKRVAEKCRKKLEKLSK